MDFRLLGPVEAWAGGRLVDVGTRRHRLVLAVLLVEVNRPVPEARLAELVWEGPPPPNAARQLDRIAGELAEVLTPGGAVRMRAGADGRTLSTDPLSVDLHRFRALLADAALTRDDVRRSRMLARALRLSRGPALAGVAPARVRDRLCGDVREARLAAAEDRFDTELRLGRHRQVLAPLAAMVRAHPLRERLSGQLMLALYRAGQPAAALGAYHEARQRLSDRLGREPAPELRTLAQAILRRDPRLSGRVPALAAVAA